MKFKNPCKKCLVQTSCTKICDNRKKFNKTIYFIFEEHFVEIVLIILVMINGICFYFI